ncbi:MAG: glycoside hydrolase family 99-like domain-containing protein [Chloroflexi bacterium]|nr:glycoside hydrolase family 99-like domain-containing protein [Chloroflexota bacterium]OJV91874.1 MAG: hypothetical protein BGO39_14190 [Chloroflexi bacterium 54-19]
MANKYEVAVYYFPQYHSDPTNDIWHRPGWTEWELVKAARPRFEGHRQPIIPAWGYFNEADPAWAAKEIDLAADHGITSFIYDWYWYEGKPFLQDGLEKGFMAAPNNQRLKFGLMWANHRWVRIFNNIAHEEPPLLADGAVDRPNFDRMVEYVVKTYFRHPGYFKIDGAPYFSIYELGTFIEGLGGLEAAKAALDHFREYTKAQGFPDLHLNGVTWGFQVLPSEVKVEDPARIVEYLGLNSVGSYVWIHHTDLGTKSFPTAPYEEIAEDNYRVWEEYTRTFPVPYMPNVSMGWDASPRTNQEIPFQKAPYPWTNVIVGNTPAAFEEALRKARDFIDAHDLNPKMLTINAWNEWTEGSYLLPDTDNGTGYLEAIKRVFGS